MMCDQCGAVNPHARTRQDLLQYVYSNFLGPWRETQRDHEAYLRETPVVYQTPWLSVPGFNISRVRWDTAHTVLLGCGKDLAASFLLDLAPRNLYMMISLIFTTYFLFPNNFMDPSLLSPQQIQRRMEPDLLIILSSG